MQDSYKVIVLSIAMLLFIGIGETSFASECNEYKVYVDESRRHIFIPFHTLDCEPKSLNKIPKTSIYGPYENESIDWVGDCSAFEKNQYYEFRDFIYEDAKTQDPLFQFSDAPIMVSKEALTQYLENYLLAYKEWMLAQAQSSLRRYDFEIKTIEDHSHFGNKDMYVVNLTCRRWQGVQIQETKWSQAIEVNNENEGFIKELRKILENNSNLEKKGTVFTPLKPFPKS